MKFPPLTKLPVAKLPVAKLLLAALALGGTALSGTDLPLWLQALGLVPALAIVGWAGWKLWRSGRLLGTRSQERARPRGSQRGRK